MIDAKENSTLQIVLEVCKDSLQNQEITEESNFNDPSIDSLTRVEMIMEFESAVKQKYDIQITLSEQFADGVTTIRSFADKLQILIDSKLMESKIGEAGKSDESSDPKLEDGTGQL